MSNSIGLNIYPTDGMILWAKKLREYMDLSYDIKSSSLPINLIEELVSPIEAEISKLYAKIGKFSAVQIRLSLKRIEEEKKNNEHTFS